MSRVFAANLDKPGALEALKRDKPAHYSRVMEAVANARNIEVDAAPTAHLTERPGQVEKAK